MVGSATTTTGILQVWRLGLFLIFLDRFLLVLLLRVKKPVTCF